MGKATLIHGLGMYTTTLSKGVGFSGFRVTLISKFRLAYRLQICPEHLENLNPTCRKLSTLQLAFNPKNLQKPSHRALKILVARRVWNGWWKNYPLSYSLISLKGVI